VGSGFYAQVEKRAFPGTLEKKGHPGRVNLA
jgi:hypothetical protein